MDLARFLGRILDWFLAEPRTEFLIGAVGIGAGIYYYQVGGAAYLMTQLANVFAACLLTAGAGLGLRKLRNVPPRKSRPKADKEREHG